MAFDELSIIFNLIIRLLTSQNKCNMPIHFMLSNTLNCNQYLYYFNTLWN